ncbi:fucolectin-like [Liolophura sinensis]|uniref:fucolectin-like n=1 Tax=Liolophura sinensis TaxID=3198878 RepID=UPI003159492D
MTLTLFNLYHFVTFFFVGYTQGRKNLALRKPAYQSSTTEYSFGGRTHLGVADYAVDGNLEVEEIGSTCIRAGWDLNPWWAVDLQDIYRIDEVAIVTRNWGFIMTNFSVELSAFTDGTPNGFINPVTCFYESGWVPQGVTRVYPCSTSTMARFVKVTRWDWAADRVMAFCQVMVYGSDTASPQQNTKDLIWYGGESVPVQETVHLKKRN